MMTTTTTTPTTFHNPIAKLLAAAGDIVERDGLISGQFSSITGDKRSPVCVRGALLRANGVANEDMPYTFFNDERTIVHDADDELYNYLKEMYPDQAPSSTAAWSNAQTDKQHVANVCREAAHYVEAKHMVPA